MTAYLAHLWVIAVGYLAIGVVVAWWSRPDAAERAADPELGDWLLSVAVVALWLPLLVAVLVRPRPRPVKAGPMRTPDVDPDRELPDVDLAGDPSWQANVWRELDAEDSPRWVAWIPIGAIAIGAVLGALLWGLL
jgi:hypothetical protein